MATAKKFKSSTGGHVSIYVAWRPDPIELPADGTYETSDKREVDALRASAEATEVKQKKGKSGA